MAMKLAAVLSGSAITAHTHWGLVNADENDRYSLVTQAVGKTGFFAQDNERGG